MNESTLYAEDFRAKTCPLPEQETAMQDLMENEAVCGLSICDSSTPSSRSTSSLKTSQSFGLEDWKRFSLGSHRSGTMRSGIVFPLPTLAPLTKETGSGLLPTLRASEWKGCGPIGSKSHTHWLNHFYLTGVVTESGKLNPTFAEAHMGFPQGWTDV